jgi:sugar lactone lactonase YvrE
MTLRRFPSALLATALALAAGCADRPAAGAGAAADLPRWTFDSSLVFPADRSLLRPEDGVALPGGRLLVADQEHGLRLVEPDGSHRPFGEMRAAGYRHAPPAQPGAANGVSLEPGGTHVLVADVYGGGIYRVDVATGAAEKVHQHRYGVNTAVRDSRGAIWFTQSAHNPPEQGEALLWAAVESGRPEGALLRLPAGGGRPAGPAGVVLDSLAFANGVAIDEAAGHLYLAETSAGRVRRFRVDLDAGRLSEPVVVLDGGAPDNLELDEAGRLWVALPLTGEVVVLTPATGAVDTVFRAATPEQRGIAAEFARRGAAGEPRMELFTPALWEPLPGLVTGVIPGIAGGPVHVTGLGNALLRLPR